VLFAITGEVPDVVLSHRFRHEHASFNAFGRITRDRQVSSRCRTFATNGPTLRRFVNLSIANVNLDTELHFPGRFILGAPDRAIPEMLGDPAGSLGGMIGSKRRQFRPH
jgi:hypothetical protein